MQVSKPAGVNDAFATASLPASREQLSPKDILRCFKCYLAREICLSPHQRKRHQIGGRSTTTPTTSLALTSAIPKPHLAHLGNDLIHAPTGAVLLQLRWLCLEGRGHDPVDGFGQPVSAWK